MEEIIDFLGEYAETLEAMEQKQIEKLGLLMTRELDKVEQTIMMQEAIRSWRTWSRDAGSCLSPMGLRAGP